MSVRVRYAPSPTGLQHIGGVRTALFNYFYARVNGGKFILRVEDTDRERYSEESLQDLYDTLNWLNIEWDEGPDKDGGFGPYTQSERADIHKKAAQELIDQDKAYRCFCTSERLDELRAEQAKDKKGPQGYDKKCRDLSTEDCQQKMDAGEKFVVRLKIPRDGSISFHDELLGDIKRKNKDVSPDPVILKSDGFPTYHLANVIDDHMMKITHVLRAQEWIPSTPLHIHIYNAFGWEAPSFCHLPMVMGKDGSKLSKRHGSTSVCDFKTNGYLPEAIVNYISLLGWSFDDSREFFTREDLEELFCLEKINKAPAVFDYKKLDWFNGQYIRKKDPEELKALLIPLLIKDDVISDPPTPEEMTIFEGAFPIILERLKLLNDVSPLLRFLFKEIETYNVEDAIPKKLDKAQTKNILSEALTIVKGFDSRNDEENEALFGEKAEELEIKLGQILQPLRVALTGTKISPPLFDSIRLLGEEKTLKRIEALLKLM